jgi:hypothetical protein
VQVGAASEPDGSALAAAAAVLDPADPSGYDNDSRILMLPTIDATNSLPPTPVKADLRRKEHFEQFLAFSNVSSTLRLWFFDDFLLFLTFLFFDMCLNLIGRLWQWIMIKRFSDTRLNYDVLMNWINFNF